MMEKGWPIIAFVGSAKSRSNRVRGDQQKWQWGEGASGDACAAKLLLHHSISFDLTATHSPWSCRIKSHAAQRVGQSARFLPRSRRLDFPVPTPPLFCHLSSVAPLCPINPPPPTACSPRDPSHPENPGARQRLSKTPNPSPSAIAGGDRAPVLRGALGRFAVHRLRLLGRLA